MIDSDYDNDSESRPLCGADCIFFAVASCKRRKRSRTRD